MSKISIIGVPMDLGADRPRCGHGSLSAGVTRIQRHLRELECDVEDLGDLE
jgi:hypothetical protein